MAVIAICKARCFSNLIIISARKWWVNDVSVQFKKVLKHLWFTNALEQVRADECQMLMAKALQLYVKFMRKIVHLKAQGILTTSCLLCWITVVSKCCFVAHFLCCPFAETTRIRHQQQREQRADGSKERRPPKPVRKVHRAAPASDLNAKPGIIILFILRGLTDPLILF